MAAHKVGGVAFLKVNGFQYLLRGDLMVSPDLYERTGVAGQDGIHGYTEAPRVPFVSGKLTDTGGLSLAELQRMIDVTVMLELNNGKHYVLGEAWIAEARELNTQEGSVEVKFEGMFCEEVLAA
jgi:hypothetical protein